MPKPPIDRSPDLRRLWDEGYALDVRSNFLLIDQVPYVDQSAQVRRGTLVSTLNLAGERTETPETHVVSFIGEFPCDEHGNTIEGLRHQGPSQLAPELAVSFSFSAKPAHGYTDYYEKITAYVAILEHPAQAIDPNASARVYPPPQPTSEADDRPFQYRDTLTSRAEIGVATGKLRLARVVIVGIGGTGSYVLDLISKTPIKEIDLYDGDVMLTHNAFRCPGAASLAELEERPKKVDYLREKYTAMHRGIIAHPYDLDASNVGELAGADFAFLCTDVGPARAEIVAELERQDISFIDVGMGLEERDGALAGIVRVTASTPVRREHFRSRAPIAPATAVADEYDKNIQIADLNALNAALAVIKFKKLMGFYRDYVNSHDLSYTVDSEMLLAEERP
jgi:molybdopterin/thiamine biosynthesis adenylyltransferase